MHASVSEHACTCTVSQVLVHCQEYDSVLLHKGRMQAHKEPGAGGAAFAAMMRSAAAYATPLPPTLYKQLLKSVFEFEPLSAALLCMSYDCGYTYWTLEI